MKLRKSKLDLRASIAIFVAVILFSQAFSVGISVYAYNEKNAVIKWDVVNIREKSTTSSSIIAKLTLGKEVTIIGEQEASDGYLWYQVKFTSGQETKQGWLRSDMVDIAGEEEKPVTPPDGVENPYEKVDFETYLKQQGFPETYKIELRKLHAKYPYWVFDAQQTGLDWNDVIKAENKLGLNLTAGDNISSWKSTQNGAYNWDTGQWIEFDTGNWVAASEAIIKYSMDPRNSLDETSIFQFLRQSYDQEAQNEAGMSGVTKGTYLSGTYKEMRENAEVDVRYTDTLMEAAKFSGVSPYTIASMLIIEQGAKGQGSSISGKVPGYEGYYNYFNIGAYPSGNLTAVQRGLWYAKGSGNGSTTYNRPWDTRTKSIIGGAQFYGEGYVKVGQDTLYLKKFNVQGKKPYTHQYMTNVRGAYGEGQRMSKAFSEDARKTNLTFKIPVFKNMPAKPCPKPTGKGSPNYMLKSLEVTGQSLTPTFDKYETEYSVIVPYETSSADIVAKAIDATATVSGAGKKSLKVGTNKFAINVKAENGSTRTYNITIIREEGSGETKPEPPVSETKLTSSVYSINASEKAITGVKKFPVKAADFAKNLKVEGGSLKVTNAKGEELKGNVGTGSQIRVYDSKDKLVETYNVIVYGDTNGDGNVDALDLLRVQKDILGISDLKGYYQTAADTSRNSSVDILDLLQVQKQIIGAGTIKQ